MKICEKVLLFVLIVAIVLLGAAVVRIEKMKHAVSEASLWVDVVDIRINELQDQTEDMKRECVFLSEAKEVDLDDRVEMVGFDCYIDKDYDQRVAVTPISPQGRVEVRTLHCERYYK